MITTGNKVGKSLLIEDGALPWIVKNANNEAAPIRRHIELALCHLAQHGNFVFISWPYTWKKLGRVTWYFKFLFAEVNAKDMISEGALWELVRISRDCSREDIRTLARRILTSSPAFQSELRRLRIEYWDMLMLSLMHWCELRSSRWIFELQLQHGMKHGEYEGGFAWHHLSKWSEFKSSSSIELVII